MNEKIDAIVFDLKYNPDEYTSLSADELLKVVNGKVDKPIRSLNANKQPMLMPIELSPIINSIGITTEELMRRVQVIKDDNLFRTRIQEAFSRKYEGSEEPKHIEQRLYSSGFMSKDDELLTLKFQNTDWEQKLSIIDKIKDSRIREFAYRIIFCEKPNLLPPEIYKKMTDWKRNRLLTTEDVPWMTVPKAIKEIEERLGSVDENDSKYLMEIKEFIEEIGNTN
jgi:exodeoxyribonuclease-1